MFRQKSLNPECFLNFIGVRTRDVLSKSWGLIVGVKKRGNIIERYRIQLDSGVIVSRTREELFSKPKKKHTHMSLAWNRDKHNPD